MMTATASLRPHPLILVLSCMLLAGCSQEKLAETRESEFQAWTTGPSNTAVIPGENPPARISARNADPIGFPAVTGNLVTGNLLPADDIAGNPSAIPSANSPASGLEFRNAIASERARTAIPTVSNTNRLPQSDKLLPPRLARAIPVMPSSSDERDQNERSNALTMPPTITPESLSRALPASRLPAAAHTPFSITAPLSIAPSNPAPRRTAETEPQSPSALRMDPQAAYSTTAVPTMLEMNAALPPASTLMPTDAAPRAAAPMPGMPSGTQPTDAGYSKVQVFYATDRQRSHVSLAAYELAGQRTGFMACSLLSILCLTYAGYSTLRSRTQAAGISAMAACFSGGLAVAMILFGQTKIEKHGVNYTGDRGQFTRGIAEVSVPDQHERGVVERPSLLRFEVREDQTKHIVLTDAVELLEDDFKLRIENAVAKAPARDLLVFIHGYNVSFEAALLRTAQLAVDLPFEGAPICYSWPSQATLTGYPIDANNADWTVPHLKEFLLDLATESGADSINVIAHSMGNRAMTAAIRQISQQHNAADKPLFDRIVLAAPDIDADYFRRDAAPALVQVANHVTLYASSDDQALIASRKVNGYPRAGDSGTDIVIAPGIETVDVSGTDLSLLGHSYYGDNETMLRELYDVLRARLPATQRTSLIQRNAGPMTYWQLAQQASPINR
ncbi:alpha/beta hydrolase [Rhodopirellula sp.]|nr:alpha/beta hydrolase [Rhodopirellula sp.]